MSDVSRVTQQSATILMVADLQSGLSQLTQLQQEAATGKQINQPSDNPAGTSEVLSLNAQLGRFQQYSSNISDGQSWLDTAGSALGSVITNLNQVQTDVLSGANTTAQASGSDQALSQDVLTIKGELLNLAATTYNNRSIFSGTYGVSPYPQGVTSGVSDPTSSSYDPDVAYAYAGSSTPRHPGGLAGPERQREPHGRPGLRVRLHQCVRLAGHHFPRPGQGQYLLAQRYRPQPTANGHQHGHAGPGDRRGLWVPP